MTYGHNDSSKSKPRKKCIECAEIISERSKLEYTSVVSEFVGEQVNNEIRCDSMCK